MTDIKMDYEFFKEVQKERNWKPQPIHYTMRFLLRVILTSVILWFIVCGAILMAPVHADTMPPLYEPQHEKLLTYVGLQIDDDSITCLIFVDQKGKLERFAWYDELSGYGKYIGSIAVYDVKNDMVAIWDKKGNCIWSDWD